MAAGAEAPEMAATPPPAMSAPAMAAPVMPAPMTAKPSAGELSTANSPANVCDGTASFTRAARVELGVEWPGTIGLEAGSGKVIVYTKLTYKMAGDQWVTDQRPCGTDLPVITTSLLVNNLKSVNRIPSSAFDSPNMPVAQVPIASAAGMLTIASGAGLFGVDLPSADAPWPALAALKPVDHDGDGKPGVTAFPEAGDGYIIPPLSAAQDRTADQVYVAARVSFTLNAPIQRCSELREGTATIAGFDYSIVGCHATDGPECTASESRFLARAAPVFTVAATGTWSQREVAENATCAQVQAAFAN
jgi:hypothetical protein